EVKDLVHPVTVLGSEMLRVAQHDGWGYSQLRDACLRVILNEVKDLVHPATVLDSEMLRMRSA
ncbi:MAG: hypothetical protein GY851_27335, partial [bacterium]|nr:hypothetical protein [bacterium]